MADHAFLSASAGDRWLHCPPSAMLCAQEEDLGSPYAQEGSDAHALCEFLLNQALSREAADPTGNLTWYNAEMQEAAEGYVSWVLDQIAEEVGSSRATVARLFEHELGHSAGEEIMRQRIDIAKRLLKNDSLSISEVAYRTGFCNPAYFSNTFRRETGFAPRTWRNATLEDT